MKTIFITIFVSILIILILPQKTFSAAFSICDSAQIDTNYYLITENPAQFQGGDIHNFRNYISQNIVVQEDSTPIGKVVFEFGVDWNGYIQRVKITRSSGNLNFDNSLFKLLQNSPRWTPAYHNGKRVGQLFIIPLMIHLQ